MQFFHTIIAMSARKTRISMQRSTSRRSSVVLKTRTDNLDEVLHEIGECSHYQIRRHTLFFLLSIPFACQSLLAVFAGQIPEICLETGPKQCATVDILQRSKICENSNHRQIVFLQKEKFSIISEFHVICNKSYLEQVANSLFFIGAFSGTIIIGWIAESFGRKPVMFCCLAVISFIATLSAFADSLWFFIMARSLTGFFVAGIAVSLYVIASEIIGFSYRTTSDILVSNYFSLGLMLLVLKAYFLENWRHLQLVTTLPYLSVLVCYRFIPESLRWLWRTGHYNRANRTVSAIADENKTSQELAVFPDVLSIESDEQEISCTKIFRLKRLLLYFTILSFLTLSTGLVYYALFLVSGYVSGNAYFDFALLAGVEIPANFLAVVSIRRIGRKKTVSIGLLVTSVFCAASCAVSRNRSDGWRSTTLAIALFSKLFLTTSLATLAIWTRELHYLMGRTHRIDIVHSFRFLGGAVAPWVTTFIMDNHPSVPFAVMCALSGLAGILSLILPETEGTKSNYDDDDEEEQSSTSHNEDSSESCKKAYSSLNGTVDSNLNETVETNVSQARKSNDILIIDPKFNYVSLSQLDRETDL